MQWSFISSTPMLEAFGIISDFCLVEVKYFLSDPKYRNFYMNTKKMKILDNSMHFGYSVSLTDLLESARTLKATFVIVPDSLADPQFVFRSLDTLEKNEHYLHYPVQIEAVCGGKSEEEFLTGFLRLLREPRVSLIAIPYRIWFYSVDPTYLERAKLRARLVAQCHQLMMENSIAKPIHLIGFNHQLECMLSVFPCVKYCDTSCVFTAGLEGKKLSESQRSSRVLNMDETLDGNQLMLALQSADYLKKLSTWNLKLE